MADVRVEGQPKVIITLTMQEACALKILLGSIGGRPDGTIRELLGPLWDQMIMIRVPDDEYVYASVEERPESAMLKICCEHSTNAVADIYKMYPTEQ